MKIKQIIVVFFLSCYLYSVSAQKKSSLKFDSLLKIGKIGYKVTCLNKLNKTNNINIRLIGFENKEDKSNSGPKEFSIPRDANVTGADIDDFDGDGSPDLLIYVNIHNTKKIYVIGIRSKNNENVEPIIMKDILDDPKLGKGYKGDDIYYLLEGTLVRSFPVYSDSSTLSNPPIYRKIFYRLFPGEQYYEFKSTRVIESSKP